MRAPLTLNAGRLCDTCTSDLYTVFKLVNCSRTWILCFLSLGWTERMMNLFMLRQRYTKLNTNVFEISINVFVCCVQTHSPSGSNRMPLFNIFLCTPQPTFVWLQVKRYFEFFLLTKNVCKFTKIFYSSKIWALTS